MIWERRGSYALACADYIIGSYCVGGQSIYVLERLSQHPTSAAARDAAHQHHNSPSPYVRG